MYLNFLIIIEVFIKIIKINSCEIDKIITCACKSHTWNIKNFNIDK